MILLASQRARMRVMQGLRMTIESLVDFVRVCRGTYKYRSVSEK
jgi:hypothetical protein